MTVYYSEKDDRKTFARKAVDLILDDIALKQKILIKPNIVSPDPYPSTTHPGLLEELIIL